MSDWLRRICDGQSAQGREPRIGFEGTKFGCAGGIEKVRKLVLDEIDGIGVHAVIEDGPAATDDRK